MGSELKLDRGVTKEEAEETEKLVDIQKCAHELYEKIASLESERLALMHMTPEYRDWEKANKLCEVIEKLKEETHKVLLATPAYKAYEKALGATGEIYND